MTFMMGFYDFYDDFYLFPSSDFVYLAVSQWEILTTQSVYKDPMTRAAQWLWARRRRQQSILARIVELKSNGLSNGLSC